MKHSKNTKNTYSETLDTECPSKFIESLNLLDAVKLVETLKTILFNAPDRDQTKIDFFKDELSTGRYKVDPHQIARQLLEHVQVRIEAEMA